MMGTSGSQIGQPDETPQHKVTISKSFHLGKYEVTQEQWVKVMGSNPSYYLGRNLPVQRVSWEDANEFITKLNEMENTNGYRLPTEAEWEYAARAGSNTLFHFGDDHFGELREYGWYKANASTPQEVGKLKPNKWGLYDMHGNVSEWVHDFYSGFDGKGGVAADRYYITSPAIDPTGPTNNVQGEHSIRGGSVLNDRHELRSADRHFCSRGYPCEKFLGFRIAITIK